MVNSNLEFLYNVLVTDDIIDSINTNLSKLVNLIPEIKDMFDFDQKNPAHHLDVWNHTLYALSISKNDFTIRLALLLHDIGKPHSYQDVDGIRHFKGHPLKSYEISLNILKRLGFSQNFIKHVCYLILNHDNVIEDIDIENDYNLQKERYEIQRADCLAHHPNHLEKRKQYLKKINDKLNNETR